MHELTAELRGALRSAGARAEVVVTENTVRLVSVLKRPPGLEVRVSKRLLSLGPRVVEPLVAFAIGRPHGRTKVRSLIAELGPAPPPRRPRVTRSRPIGLHHDLRPLFAAEAQRLLGEVPAGVRVTWGPKLRLRPGQRSLRLGSYATATRTIRIARVLDHPAVPAWFLAVVLHHELCHHFLGIDESGPRRAIHPPEFRRLEASHPDFLAAERWERDHLHLLLRGRLGR